MAFDRETQIRILFQKGSGRLELAHLVRSNFRLIVVEENRLHGTLDLLIHSQR